jgi:CubicO group peptidase (beta-lactamase class C family)
MAVIAFLGACLTAGAAAGDQPPRLADSEFKDLKPRWEDAMRSFGVPGCSVAVVRDGRFVLLDAWGVRSVESGKPVDPDTMFYMASCTKTFNAMAAVALAADGKLKLDDPVKHYLQQLTIADTNLARKVTVRDLLCHRHGINRGEIVLRDAYTGQIDDETYFRLLAGADAAGRTSYTNVHYTITGRVIEALSGKPWGQYLEERILKPAGMTRTTAYAGRMYGDDNCALPHVFEEGWKVSPVIKTDRTMHAAGGLGSTARDLGRWMLLNLNEGQIDGKQVIPADAAREMLVMQAELPEPRGFIRIEDGFGLGWQLGRYRGKEPFAGHGGGYIGTAAYFAILPQRNAGVAVLANTDDMGQALTAIIAIDVLDRLSGLKGDDDLLPGYKQRAEAYRSRQSPSREPVANGKGLELEASAYVGRYSNRDAGVLDLKNQDGRLTVEFGDLTMPLWAQEDGVRAVASPGLDFEVRFHVKEGAVVGVTLLDEGRRMLFRRE